MVRIATLPGELDPDELLHKSGVAGWDAALEKALDLPAYRTELALQGRKGPLAAEEKSRIAAAVLETVRKSSDEVLKREWLRRLAQRLELDEESLHLELNRSSDAPPTRRIRPAAPAVRDAKPVPAGEEMILLALLRQPGLAADPALVAENDFSHPGARAIFSGIRAAAGPGDWTGRLLASLPGPDAAAARAMLCDPRSMDDPARSVAEQVSRLRKGRRLEELRPKVVAMTGGGLPADPELQAEYGRLLSELKGARKGD
jgi:DNA primase